ncbi:hypothetical protein NWQ33_00430 [Mycoplasmopsis cynos]|nr:hypothetical protein [Mycoplasmopsis cynos]
MTAYFKDIANEYYVDNPRIVLESLLYSTNEQDNNDIKFGVYNQFLNKNIFFLNGKTVQFALTLKTNSKNQNYHKDLLTSIIKL